MPTLSHFEQRNYIAGTVKRLSVIYKQTNKQSEKHHTLSSHAGVRRSISTKFCMVIEVVRAFISSLKLLLGPINSSTPIGHRKFG